MSKFGKKSTYHDSNSLLSHSDKKGSKSSSSSKSKTRAFHVPAVRKQGETGRGYIMHTKTQNKTFAPTTKKSRRLKTVLVWVGIAAATLLLAGAAGAFAYVYSLDSSLHAEVDEAVLDVLAEQEGGSNSPFYMLLIGCDTRSTSSSSLHGLSDTLILARVNPEKKVISLISIPRDTYVEIPGYGSTKINAAYSYGGAALAIQTVSNFANVEINHYAEINFAGFKEVIEAMGGVTIDVPESWYDPKLNYSFSAGEQTLDGTAALMFCRSRTGFADIPDFGRTEHQRLFLKTVANQLLNDTSVAQMTNVLSSIADCVSTDLSLTDLTSLAMDFRSFSTDDMRTAMVPSTTRTIDGISYVITLEDEWDEMLVNFNNDEPLEESETDAEAAALEARKEANSQYTITVRNGAGTQGIGTECAKRLQAAGYKIDAVANADSFVYDETLVVYSGEDKMDQAQEIVNDLGIGHIVEAGGKYAYDGDFLVVVGADWK